MIFKNEKYTINFDLKGAIVSLESSGKQFVKTRLPLFVLQLRNGGETALLNSDELTTEFLALM